LPAGAAIGRVLLIIAGTVCVALGAAGVVLPLLPTTPFLLLAAACYARSSPRFYRWLLENRWFGGYIRNYREKRGVPVRVKAGTLLLLWAAILSSAFFVVEAALVRVLLIAIAIGVTVHVLSIKTLRQ
jgi:uncharacterized protein